MPADDLIAILLALAVGLLLGWLLGQPVAVRLRRRVSAQAQQIHELDVERAASAAQRESLEQQQHALGMELRALRDEHTRCRSVLAALHAREQAQERRHREQLELLESNRRQLREEFENLANRIFEERGRRLGETQHAALDALLKPFAEQIERFQSRVNEVHRASVAGQAGLIEQLRQLQQIGLHMSEQADGLSRALTGDKKTTGNWGEVQLERCLQLAGLEPGQHYEAQSALRSSAGQRQLPDFLVKLPDGKHLVLDSKVSLVDYQRAVAAEDEAQRQQSLQAHVQALRRHVDDLAAKDYSALPGLDSPSLVFMFTPVEAAFVEALRCDGELYNYGHRRNVILCSPTTLLPMLRTVANLWTAYQSDTEARAISTAAGEVYNKVVRLSQRLDELGRALGTAVGRYNQTVTALVGRQGLHGRVERFRSIASNARGELPAPVELQPAVDNDRLAPLHGDQPLSDDQ
jgi:DNA recombination protein RmuC